MRLLNRLCVSLVLVLGLLLATGISPPSPGDDPSLRKLEKDLGKAVRLGDEEGANSAVRDLAALGTKAALQILLRAAMDPEAVGIRDSIPGALAGVTEEKGIEFLSTLLVRPKRTGARFNHWEMRVLVVEAFGRRKDGATLPPLFAALSDRAFPVRLSAIRVLAGRGERMAVPHLIELLQSQEEDPGILWQETLEALQSITETEIVAGVDWKSWWEAHSGDAPLPPGKEGRREEDSKKTRTRTPTFFGVKLLSKRIVFLIDISGSMRLSDPPGEGEQPKGSREKGDPKKWQKGRERLGRAKRELIGTLKALRPGVRFNIVAFAENVEAFASGRLVPGKRPNVAKAIQFVEGLQPRNGTATDDALRAGFGFAEANAIVLLSDGVPAKMTGPDPTAEEIIEMVRELNRLRKVRIHPFGFDGEGIRPPGMPDHPALSRDKLEEFRIMMKKLAEENHGKYTSIR